jgi:hypothetical protein
LSSADFAALFRRFRHDLFNDLQILSGHIQLGRPSQTLREDVNQVIERIQALSRIFSCKDDDLALLLWNWQERASDREVSISFEVDPLPGPAAAERLVIAEQAFDLLLEQVQKLDDEEGWLGVIVQSEPMVLRLSCSALVQQEPTDLAGFTSEPEEDGQLTFVLPLA